MEGRGRGRGGERGGEGKVVTHTQLPTEASPG